MRRLSLVAPLVAALAACGGADGPSPVSQAVGATRESGTARTWYRSVLVHSGEAPETLASARGVVDFRTGRGASRWSTPFLGALIGSGDTTLTADVVYTRSATYVRLPRADNRQPWRRFARDEPIIPDSPTEGFEFLSGESRRVLALGREAVRGVATAHYRVELATAPIAERSSPAERHEIEKDERAFVPIDVWIDGSGLIRRVRWDDRFQIGDTTGAVVVTTEYFAFGTDVTIDVPPPDQVGG